MVGEMQIPARRRKSEGHVFESRCWQSIFSMEIFIEVDLWNHLAGISINTFFINQVSDLPSRSEIHVGFDIGGIRAEDIFDAFSDDALDDVRDRRDVVDERYFGLDHAELGQVPPTSTHLGSAMHKRFS